MMERKKISSLLPMLRAFIVSVFISAEITMFLFVLSAMLVHGVLQNIGYVLSLLCSVGFFVWFFRYAFLIEKMLQNEKSERENTAET